MSNISKSLPDTNRDVVTHVDNPRLDSAKGKVIRIAGFADSLPVVKHPTDLERREVRGKRQAGAKSIRIRSCETSIVA